MAKYQGFSPILTTASPHNAEMLKALGATAVLDRTRAPAQILAELPKLTGGKPIEFVYDAISLADTQPLAYEALADGGSLVIVLPELIPAELKKAGDGKTIAHVFGNVQHPECRPCGEEMYKRLTEWLEKGIVKASLLRQCFAGQGVLSYTCNTAEQSRDSSWGFGWHPKGP